MWRCADKHRSLAKPLCVVSPGFKTARSRPSPTMLPDTNNRHHKGPPLFEQEKFIFIPLRAWKLRTGVAELALAEMAPFLDW